MKNLIFFFTLLLGVVFSSNLSAQAEKLITKPSTLNFKSRDIITQNLGSKITELRTTLNGISNDPIAEKAATVEILMYKQFLSEMNAGGNLEKAYNDNVDEFAASYPEFQQTWAVRKMAAFRDFNTQILN